MYRVDVHRIPTAAPDDVKGLADLIERGVIDPRDIICVLGKTEGNGCVNDWSRGFATTAYKAMLAERLRVSGDEVARRVLFIMSGGTEGVLSPHITVFSRRSVDERAAGAPRLAAGIHHTAPFGHDAVWQSTKTSRNLARSRSGANTPLNGLSRGSRSTSPAMPSSNFR